MHVQSFLYSQIIGKRIELQSEPLVLIDLKLPVCCCQCGISTSTKIKHEILT